MASYTRQALLVLKRIAIVIGIAIAFSLGLLGAIYLSLRSSETRVPDIVGKDRAAAENTISDAGLNQLASFPKLRRVEASGSGLSDQGIAKLKQTIPEVEVIR